MSEFGNYIGADLDSDEDDIDIGENSAAGPSTMPSMAAAPSAAAGFAPLEGLEEDEDEDMEGEVGGGGMEMTLHGVDGEALFGALRL